MSIHELMLNVFNIKQVNLRGLVICGNTLNLKKNDNQLNVSDNAKAQIAQITY